MKREQPPGAPMRRNLWRSLAELARDGRVAEARAREFAPGRRRTAGSRRAPRLLAARGGERGAGEHVGLQSGDAREDPTLRHPAAGGGPRQPALLRDLDERGRVRARARRREPRGPPDEDRGESRAPREPRRDRAASSRRRSSICTIPIAREASPSGASRSSWQAFIETFAPRIAARGSHLILAATSSPLIADQVARLRARNPSLDVRWHAPLAPTAAWEGARIAFGRVLEPRVSLAGARVIVALDSDFLATGPAGECSRATSPKGAGFARRPMG